MENLKNLIGKKVLCSKYGSIEIEEVKLILLSPNEKYVKVESVDKEQEWFSVEFINGSIVDILE